MDYIISKCKMQKKEGLVGIFGIFVLPAENQSSRQRACWRQQQSAGLLRQDFESPTDVNAKTADPKGSAVFGASSGIATRCRARTHSTSQKFIAALVFLGCRGSNLRRSFAKRRQQKSEPPVGDSLFWCLVGDSNPGHPA